MASFSPALAELSEATNVKQAAALFHAALIYALADWVGRVVPADSLVAASGGCMQNQVFARELRFRLGQRGLHLMEARRVPPSDGGLSLGQAWVAQRYLLGSGMA